MSVNDLFVEKHRPACIKFERRAIEDVAASREQGRYVAKDQDFVFVRPPGGSKDIIDYKVEVWLEKIKRDVHTGRTPEEWAEAWKLGYQKWKQGQEMPLNGTPVRGWGMISPAKQENLIHIGIMTVEDLAAMNDEGRRRVGMGALDLQNKAKAWLQSLNDHGPLTQSVVSLEKENNVLKGQVESLQRQVQALLSKNEMDVDDEPPSEMISAGDILEEDKPRRGRPPKRNEQTA